MKYQNNRETENEPLLVGPGSGYAPLSSLPLAPVPLVQHGIATPIPNTMQGITRLDSFSKMAGNFPLTKLIIKSQLTAN